MNSRIYTIRCNDSIALLPACILFYTSSESTQVVCASDHLKSTNYALITLGADWEAYHLGAMSDVVRLRKLTSLLTLVSAESRPKLGVPH